MSYVVLQRESSPRRTKWQIAGAMVLGAAAAVGVGIFIARDQMHRHRRDLFDRHPLRRLASLYYLRAHPSADDIPLLRDYIAWEEKSILRNRALTILGSIEETLRSEDPQRSDESAAPLDAVLAQTADAGSAP